MNVLHWTLLGFAAWTLIVLLAGVGVKRWSKILTGRASLTSFPADTPHGDAAYRRAMRAHANCVENLPVYGAIVLCAQAAGVMTPDMALLACALLAARVAQSCLHMMLPETNLTVAVRFVFFMTQVAAMMTMIVIIVRHSV